MSQYDVPRELIVNFQDVEAKVDDLSKDLLALFVEVDNELVDVLVYAVREHYAVIPYKPQRTMKFTLRNLYRHETIGDAKLRMSLFNNFDGSLEQTLYLDGMEKYRLESNSNDDKPFAKLVYEWRDPDPEPARDEFDEVRFAIEQARASHLETEDRIREVELSFAYLARNSVENMLVKQIHINDFKEVTDKQHETSKKILEDAKAFSQQEGDVFRREADEVNAKVRDLEIELRKLEDEINSEENKSREHQVNIRDYAPIKASANRQADKDGRYAIKEEVSKVTLEIADKTLQNINKSKEDGLLGGLSQISTKQALFDDILTQQLKAKETKLSLEGVKAEIRNHQCDLAKKEFDLQMLEQESKRLNQRDRDLGMRVREADEALQAMLADRKDANDRGRELEDRAKEYEQLLAQIEQEVNQLKSDAEGQKEATEKDLFKNSGTNNDEIQKLQTELDHAERERDDALNKLEAMEGAWVSSVEEVSTEAEKLAADAGDLKFREEVQGLLKDILDSSNRSADLYKELEESDQKINLFKIVDEDKIAKEFAQDVKDRNTRLVNEEEAIVGEINNGISALDEKIKSVEDEQNKIPPLQEELERLLNERNELEVMLQELIVRKQQKDDEMADRERKYQTSLADYQRRIDEINREIKKVQGQIDDVNKTINNLRPQIDDLRVELETWITKIRLKREIIKKRKDVDEREDEYVPVVGDPIDLKIANFKNKKITQVPIKRIDPGEYMFGTMRIQIVLDGKQPSNYSVVVVKTKKKHDLEEFIRNESKRELEKISKIEEDQEMVVDESEKLEVRRSPGRGSQTNSPARSPSNRGTDYSNVVTTDKISKFRR